MPDRSIPKDRRTLKGGEWFAHVISKMAPLEWWIYEESFADVKRENYRSDWGFQLARNNTWEFPRFCFSLFRPSVDSYTALLSAIDNYEGAVAWRIHDGKIGATPVKGKSCGPILGMVDVSQFENMLQDLVRNPLQAEPAFVKKAVADIPALCCYLEQRLGLQTNAPKDFDSRWLTPKGLAKSKGEFEEFFEPGSWSVFLTHKPAIYAKRFQPTSLEDRSLSMGIGMFQCDELFVELQARWNAENNSIGHEIVLPAYPMLSRLSNIASDALYEPDEVPKLLTELIRAQKTVKKSESIRGLDNLIRIARWAIKLKVGIYFGGQ